MKDIKFRRLLKELSRPVHGTCIRDWNYKPGPKTVTLATGYQLIIRNATAKSLLVRSIRDFHRFMSTAMKVKRIRNGYKIQVFRRVLKANYQQAPEAYQIDVQPQYCMIIADDIEGMRRALIYLEDEMTARRSPVLRLGKVSRLARIVDRITRSPCAPYRWRSGWELEDARDYYPDEYLNHLAHCGINGIWVAGLYRRLIASKVLPELGPAKHRLKKLRQLVAKAGRYGIKVYFFCIEPRAVPDDHPVFAAHPEIKGAKMYDITSALCVSHPLVKNYVREATQNLFHEVPGLGGIINIFNGERGTTCWFNQQYADGCSRCRKRKQWDVLADSLNLFYEGMREASSDGKLLAWTYNMDCMQNSMTAKPVKPVLEIMKRTHPEVIWLANFEHGGQKRLGRKLFHVNEYSLSYIGPSTNFRKIADMAAKRGCRVYAKLQVGNTYEVSSVPYLPMPNTVYDKVAAMNKTKTTGAMASWIIGGYPGIMLKALGEASFLPLQRRDLFLKRLASLAQGKGFAGQVVKAWTCFSQAFQFYPCNNDVFYHGPITRSPAYHLYLRRQDKIAWPYNFGYDTQRRPQPYEDALSRWLGTFTTDEIIEAFRNISRLWSKGVRILESVRERGCATNSLRIEIAAAKAARLQFLSTANIYEFYKLRDRLKSGAFGTQKTIMARMRRIALSDVAAAQEMKRYLAESPFIGFESEILDYSYSRKLIDAKIRQVENMLNTLTRWQQHGVDEKTVSIPALTEENIRMQHENHLYEVHGWQNKNGKLKKLTYREWLDKGD